MMINRFFVLSVLFALAFSARGTDVNFSDEEKDWIAANPIIEYGYEPNWEPYEIYTQGKYTGIVGEYVKILSSKTGIEFRPIPGIKWRESLERLKSGRIKMVPSCAISNKRKEYLLFTESYIVDPFVIATRNKYEFVGNLNDLNGKTITLPESYYAFEWISENYPDIEIIECKSIRECLEFVSFKKADAFVGSLGVISYYINHKGFTNLKISAPTKLDDINIAMAFPKDEKILHGICSKVIASISLQERSRIRKDWISVKYEYSFNWTRLLTLTLFIIAVMILGFAIFFFWNRSLKKEINRRKQAELKLQDSLQKIQRQDQEKGALLAEIHHRVKNNLQMINSMMRLQSNASNDERVKTSLKEATDRVSAIALVHQKIYGSNNMGMVSLQSYFSSLAVEIVRSFGKEDINIEINAQDQELNMKTLVPLALIVNELITNSVKHGLENRSEGNITLEISCVNRDIEMFYSDNGVWKEEIKSGGFGTSLIEVFTEQLEGRLNLFKKESGTFYEFHLITLESAFISESDPQEN